MKLIDTITGRTFCGHQFIRMLFFSVFITALSNLNFISDKILATQLLGKDAMAGIEIVLPLIYVTAFLEYMIATGTRYLYSFEVGAFNVDQANRIFGQGVFLTLLLSALLTIILFLGEDLYFSLFANAPTIISYSQMYYEPFLATIAIHPLCILMKVMVYSDGGGNYCVVATVVQIIVHISVSFF